MKKNIKKQLKKAKKPKKPFFHCGSVTPQKARILVLLVVNIFLMSGILIAWSLNPEKNNPIEVVSHTIIKSNPMEKEINKMVQGYPIEKMTPYIIKQDPIVAAFLVGIAKKESAWGKRKPVLNGEDCFNYWGFRQKAEKMGSGGHTCFDSPEEAVETVASRIDELVKEEKIDTAKEMVVWKCGYGCQNREKDASELKWIKDVDLYYSKLIN